MDTQILTEIITTDTTIVIIEIIITKEEQQVTVLIIEGATQLIIETEALQLEGLI